jgi:hypothetical protein
LLVALQLCFLHVANSCWYNHNPQHSRREVSHECRLQVRRPCGKFIFSAAAPSPTASQLLVSVETPNLVYDNLPVSETSPRCRSVCEKERNDHIKQGQSKSVFFFVSVFTSKTFVEYQHAYAPGLRPYSETCPRRMGFENASFAYRSSPSSQVSILTRSSSIWTSTSHDHKTNIRQPPVNQAPFSIPLRTFPPIHE